MSVLVKFQMIDFSLNCTGIQNCRWRHVHITKIRRQKTRPNSHAPWNQNNGVRLSWRVGIMIYTAFFFSNNIMAIIKLFVLTWKQIE